MRQMSLCAFVSLVFSVLLTGCPSGGENCKPNDHTLCREGAVYWVDSCGTEGNKFGDCECGCSADSTSCEVPDCDARECGPDPRCQTSCGDCPAEQVCDDGTCVLQCEDGETRCNVQVVETCESNNWLPGLDCADNGSVCENGACVTDCTWGYTGDDCTDCAEGFVETSPIDGFCRAPCSVADPECPMFQECNFEDGGSYCDCMEGYIGPTCTDCAEGYSHGISNDGICHARCFSLWDCPPRQLCDDGDGTSVCVCMEGYTGVNCTDCTERYVESGPNGEFCRSKCSVEDPRCPPIQECNFEDGGAYCDCMKGYTGVNCTDCAEGFVETAPIDGFCRAPCSVADPECPMYQECNFEDGGSYCDCKEGYIGPTCTDCAEGYIHHLWGCGISCSDNTDCPPGQECNDGYGTPVCG